MNVINALERHQGLPRYGLWNEMSKSPPPWMLCNLQICFQKYMLVRSLLVRSLSDKTFLFESKRRRLPLLAQILLLVTTSLVRKCIRLVSFNCWLGVRRLMTGSSWLRYTELLWSVTSSEMYMLRKGCANNKIVVPLSCNMKRLMLWVGKWVPLNKPVLERNGKRKWRNALFPILTKQDVRLKKFITSSFWNVYRYELTCFYWSSVDLPFFTRKWRYWQWLLF